MKSFPPILTIYNVWLCFLVIFGYNIWSYLLMFYGKMISFANASPERNVNEPSHPVDNIFGETILGVGQNKTTSPLPPPPPNVDVFTTSLGLEHIILVQEK